MVWLNVMKPLPEFIVNGTSLVSKNEPQHHHVTHPMGSSVSLPRCKFEYQNLNINCHNQRCEKGA